MMKDALILAITKSMFRKLLSVIAGFLLAKGLVDAEIADRLTSEAVTWLASSAIILGTSIYMSYKNVIIELVKTQIAKLFPPNTSIEAIEDTANAVHDKKAVARGEFDPDTVVPAYTRADNGAGRHV